MSEQTPPCEAAPAGRPGPVDLVVFDLDGVIYRGEEPMPGAAETVAELRRAGYRVRFLTNNSTRSRQSYVERLAGFGIVCGLEEMMTSAYGTACWFAEHHLTGAAMVVGEQGLADELAAVGLETHWAVDPTGIEQVQYVVCGLDRGFDYRRLLHAQQAILHGARFIATNRDPTFPVEGRIIPGGGCMVAAIECAAGQPALTIGKPETYTVELILRQAGRQPGQAVMVGDRVDIDVLVGRRAGMWTVLSLTGIGTREEAAAAPAELAPHVIIPDLRHLPEALAAIGRRAGEGRP